MDGKLIKGGGSLFRRKRLQCNCGLRRIGGGSTHAAGPVGGSIFLRL
jgi:hypothetical protein